MLTLCSNVRPAPGQHLESPSFPHGRRQIQRHHGAAVAGRHQRLSGPPQETLPPLRRNPHRLLLGSVCSTLLRNQVWPPPVCTHANKKEQHKKPIFFCSMSGGYHCFSVTELTSWKWFWEELSGSRTPAVSRFLKLRSTGSMRSLTMKHLTTTLVSRL